MCVCVCVFWLITLQIILSIFRSNSSINETPPSDQNFEEWLYLKLTQGVALNTSRFIFLCKCHRTRFSGEVGS